MKNKLQKLHAENNVFFIPNEDFQNINTILNKLKQVQNELCEVAKGMKIVEK